MNKEYLGFLEGRNLSMSDRLILYYNSFLNGHQEDFHPYDMEGSCIDLMIKLRRTYSFDNLNSLTNHNIPVILNNDNSMIVSPLIIPFYKWKELIKYDLSICKDSFVQLQNLIIGILDDLKYRLNSETISDVNEVDFWDWDLICEYGGSSFLLVGDSIKINSYIEYVEGISLEEVQFPEYSDLDLLLKKIGKLEEEQVKKGKRSELTINPSYSENTLQKMFSLIENKIGKPLRFNSFIKNHTDLITNKESSIDYSITLNYEDERDDIIDFFSYLKEQEIILKSRSNSSRKLAGILYSFYKLETKPETIRRKLDNKSSALSKSIRQELNYLKK